MAETHVQNFSQLMSQSLLGLHEAVQPVRPRSSTTDRVDRALPGISHITDILYTSFSSSRRLDTSQPPLRSMHHLRKLILFSTLVRLHDSLQHLSRPPLLPHALIPLRQLQQRGLMPCEPCSLKPLNSQFLRAVLAPTQKPIKGLFQAAGLRGLRRVTADITVE